MGTVRAEYQEFIASLARQAVPDDVLRVAHIVGRHLAALVPLGATRRARSVRLAPLLMQELDAEPIDLPELGEAAVDGPTFHRLHQLTVGPFRGFMSQETFDLSRAITLVYGANGTGKSSLCEAMEWALLGNINEADSKRIDQRTYCHNARLRRHVPPALIAHDAQGQPVEVQASEEAFRFCFIEKNRIEGFARIAARTPGDQRQLIATLFGVDQFNEFVRGFNPDLDENLNLQGRKGLALQARRVALAAAEQTVRDYDAAVAGWQEQEAELASRIQAGATYDEACAWLMGADPLPGRLSIVRAAIDTPPNALLGITRAQCEARLVSALAAEESLKLMSQQLQARTSDVSYRKLYEAVRDLAAANQTSCPACGTAIDKVARDPYERAREGLAQLGELADLQRQEAEQRELVAEEHRSLHDLMRRVLQAAQPEQVGALPQLPERPEGTWLDPWLNDARAAWCALLDRASGIERADAQAQQAAVERPGLLTERDTLEGLEREISALATVRNEGLRRFNDAKALIDAFEDENRELIAEAAAEVPEVTFHQRIKAGYDPFVVQLKAFMAQLPGQLLQGLGRRVRDFYNGFNRDDPAGDLLSELWLPVAENEKIELEFVGEPGLRYDALQILSEGHIRCLGLAILLAKNMEQGCPVVIFDDAVNAIDDDHRNGIWRTLFEDGALDGKQVILTSHGEEFLLRIQQELGAQRVRDEVRVIKFLPHLGEHELRVDTDPPTKNYVLLAEQAIGQDDKRDALKQSRPALESLTDRLWKWLGRHGDGRIDLKISGPGAPFELNNKCAKLSSALRGLADRPGLDEAQAALVTLLGVNGASIEWGYLNAGVHDAQRGGEFDRATVRTIVGAVVQLDAALDLLQNRVRN